MGNSKGQSLLGIMIALGVGVGLVLFSMNAFKFASKSKKEIEINSKNLGNFAQLQQLRKNISTATEVAVADNKLTVTVPVLKPDGTYITKTVSYHTKADCDDKIDDNQPCMIIGKSNGSSFMVKSITSINWWSLNSSSSTHDLLDDVPDLPLISNLRAGTINRVIVRLTYEVERNKNITEKVLYVVIIMDKMYSSDEDIKPDVLFF